MRFPRHDLQNIIAERDRPDFLDKVRTILTQLNEAWTIEDMRMTSFR
jgi:hypothetical protein